jgi:hypothetical protein
LDVKIKSTSRYYSSTTRWLRNPVLYSNYH